MHPADVNTCEWILQTSKPPNGSSRHYPVDEQMIKQSTQSKDKILTCCQRLTLAWISLPYPMFSKLSMAVPLGMKTVKKQVSLPPPHGLSVLTACSWNDVWNRTGCIDTAVKVKCRHVWVKLALLCIPVILQNQRTRLALKKASQSTTTKTQVAYGNSHLACV